MNNFITDTQRLNYPAFRAEQKILQQFPIKTITEYSIFVKLWKNIHNKLVEASKMYRSFQLTSYKGDLDRSYADMYRNSLRIELHEMYIMRADLKQKAKSGVFVNDFVRKPERVLEAA